MPEHVVFCLEIRCSGGTENDKSWERRKSQGCCSEVFQEEWLQEQEVSKWLDEGWDLLLWQSCCWVQGPGSKWGNWDVLKDHWRQYSKEHSKYYYDDDDDLEDMEGEAADDDDEDDDGYVLDLPNLAAVGDTISASGTNEVDAAMIIQGMGGDSL